MKYGVALLKWFFPNPSADLRSFVLSIVVCAVTTYFFVSHGKDYVDKNDNEIKSELVKKESQAKKAIENESGKIIIVLNHIKENMNEMKVEIKDINQKVWQLSQGR